MKNMFVVLKNGSSVVYPFCLGVIQNYYKNVCLSFKNIWLHIIFIIIHNEEPCSYLNNHVCLFIYYDTTCII